MKKSIVVLSMLLTMACAAAHAVDLQQGWYARFEYVMLEGGHMPWEGWGTDWYPTSNLGQYDSIKVEEGSRPAAHGRTISILGDTTVDSGILFEDRGNFAQVDPYYGIANMTWETSYDASKLLLQVFRSHEGQPDELVWSQNQSVM